MRDFIDRNIDSPLDLLTAEPGPAGGARRLPAAGAEGRRSTCKDERTQRVFSFQAMYAGLSPYDALAIYAVIAYMDSVAGVYFPRGGMHAVPRALAGAAEKHGVEIRYGDDGDAGRARAAAGRSRCITADGERVAVRRRRAQPGPAGGLPRPARRRAAAVRRLRYSPSCFLLLAGSTRGVRRRARTTTSTSARRGGEVFDELIAAAG